MKRNYLVVLCGMVSLVFLSGLNVIAAPPTEGLKLWLKADDGAMKPEPNAPGGYIPAEVGDTVTMWLDKSGSGHDTNYVWGAPTLMAVGSQKAIRFDGNDGYRLADYAGLRLPTISVYVVADMDDNVVDHQVIVGDYSDVSGYALGLSPEGGKPGRVKWFTASNWLGDSMESGTLPTDTNRYTIINGTFDPAATTYKKALYFDGQHKLKGTGTGLTYYTTSIASIGVLDVGRQWTRGNISEILIYDSVSADQYYAVHSYLSQKYGIPVTNDYQGDDPTVVFLKYLFMQSSDDQGVPVEGQTWNTTQLYDGTYWDLAVLDDTIANLAAITDPNLLDPHTLNNITNGDIEAAMNRGNTYTFAFTGNGEPNEYDLTSDYYTMSFYFDQKDTPGITIFTAKDTTGPTDGHPDFGYPAGGPVIWKSVAKGVQIRLTDFVLYPKSAPDVSLDIQTEPWNPPFYSCQPYDPDGVEDIVGQFTLSVEFGDFTCADMGQYYPMDFDQNCYVDLQDFARFAQDWLTCNNPADGDCTWPIEESDPNAVILSGMTMSTTDDTGMAYGPEFWNTVPEDGAWDIALFDTTLAVLMSDPNQIAAHLQNDPNRDISIEVSKGNTYSYSFAMSHDKGTDLGSLADPNSFHSQIGLLFDSQASGLAGFVPNDYTGPSDGHAAVAAPADGSLIWKSFSKLTQVRLTDFVIYPKSVADISLDIMGTGTANPTGAFVPDGEKDVVGEFTIVVEDGAFTCTEAGQFYPTDFDKDCYVNLEDYALFARKWLECNDPENGNCTWPIAD